MIMDIWYSNSNYKLEIEDHRNVVFFLYLGIRKFQKWLISRSLQVKIIVSFILEVMFIGTIVWANLPPAVAKL